MTAVQEPPLAVEQWSAANTELVRRMRQMRPGLTEVQAHMAVQALESLHMTLHAEGAPCRPARVPSDTAPVAGGSGTGVCGATATGAYGATLNCLLEPHAGQPWHDNGRTQWQCIGTNGLWLMTSNAA